MRNSNTIRQTKVYLQTQAGLIHKHIEQLKPSNFEQIKKLINHWFEKTEIEIIKVPVYRYGVYQGIKVRLYEKSQKVRVQINPFGTVYAI